MNVPENSYPEPLSSGKSMIKLSAEVIRMQLLGDSKLKRNRSEYKKRHEN